MKKLTLFFFALLAVCLAFQACDNSKPYAEMLEEEKDAIKAFIKDLSLIHILQPEKFIPEVKALGAHVMNVHYEACPHLHRVVQV